MEDNTLVKSSFSATINAPIENWRIFHPGALRFPSRNTKVALQPKGESDSTGRRSHSTDLTIDLGDCIG